MRRSSSPRFGDPVFRRCSRDEFEWRLGLLTAFPQDMMGSEVAMNADADAEAGLIRGERVGKASVLALHTPKMSRTIAFSKVPWLRQQVDRIR